MRDFSDTVGQPLGVFLTVAQETVLSAAIGIDKAGAAGSAAP